MLLVQDCDINVYRDIDLDFGYDEEGEDVCWESDYSLRDPDWCISSEEEFLRELRGHAELKWRRLLLSHTTLTDTRKARADMDEIQSRLDLLATLPSYQELCGGC